jgi:signal peptidase II
VKLRTLGLALAATIFAVDQWFKGQVRGPMDLANNGPVTILPFFDLRWTENYGVSLGMFTAQSSEMRWLLVALTGAIAVGVVIWMLREKGWPEILGLALVLGGALGNIRDRIKYGYVIDYADLHFGAFRPFLIFNLADAAITVGVLIILARSFLSREKRPEPAKDPAADIAEAKES